MAQAVQQAATRPAVEVIRHSAVTQAANGACYALVGELPLPAADFERMVGAVPQAVARALERKAFYFVPLTVGQGDETLIADRYDVALSDNAVCHRNFGSGDSQVVFISTRLMEDRFSVAFEFFINVAHGFVERAGVSREFSDLAWNQVQEKVRGETSLDAYELRKAATSGNDEKARYEYLEAAFSDSIAIYMLSLFLDVDYYDLRERDYTLITPQGLAERLRKINELFPPNAGYEFAVFYRRRS